MVAVAQRLYVPRVQSRAAFAQRHDMVIVEAVRRLTYRANISAKKLGSPVRTFRIKIIAGAKCFNESSPNRIVTALGRCAAGVIVLLSALHCPLSANPGTGQRGARTCYRWRIGQAGPLLRAPTYPARNARAAVRGHGESACGEIAIQLPEGIWGCRGQGHDDQ